MEVPRKLIKVIEDLMDKWKIKLCINNKEIGKIKLNRGILQGDSLSSKLFVIAINIVSKKIK